MSGHGFKAYSICKTGMTSYANGDVFHALVDQNFFDTQFPIFRNLPAETNGFFEQT